MLKRIDLLKKNLICIKNIILILLFLNLSLTAAEYKVPFGLIVDTSEYTTYPEIVSIDSLIFGYKFDEAVQFSQTILTNKPHKQTEALLYKRIGFAYYQNGYYDSSAVYFKKYYNTAGELQDELEKGHALYYIGLNQIELGMNKKADDNFRISLNIYNNIDSLERDWQLYPLIALIYQSWGSNNLDSTNNYILQCDSIFRQESQVSDYLKYKYFFKKASFARMNEKYQVADSIFQQSILIAENKLDAISKSDVYLAYGALQADLREYNLFDKYSKKALETIVPILRPDHPLIGYCYLSLSQVYQESYNFEAASENFEQAENIIINAFGKEHVNYASLLQTKSTLYLEMRIYDKAIDAGEERVLVLSKLYGENSEQTMYAVFDLAVIYISLEEFEKGITLFKKFRNYHKESNSTQKVTYLMSSQYLAYAYQKIDKYDEAYELLTSIKSEMLEFYGVDNLDYGNYELFNGMVAYALGFYDKAEKHYLAAKDIFTKKFLPQNPKIGGVRSYLAILYGSKKEYDKSLAMFKEFLKYRNIFLESVYSYSSAEQKIRYLATHTLLLDGVNSLAFLSQEQAVKDFAYNMLLRGKSVALEAITSENRIVQYSTNDTVKKIYNELSSIAEKLTSMNYAIQDSDSLETINLQFQSLIEEKNSLEFRLSSLCSEYSDFFTQQKIKLQDVQKKLSQNTILLEYASFDPYLFESSGSTISRFEKAHYALFVLDNKNELKMFDLGTASEIDSLIEEVRTSLQANQIDVYTAKSRFLEQQLKEKTKKLYQKLIEPVKDMLVSKDKIYLATDGLLNILPFDILPVTDSTYMIEEYELSYITSGREIIKYDNQYSKPLSMTIYYNPDYNFNNSDGLLAAEDDTLTDMAALRGNDNCLQEKFNDLPFTVQEVSSITSLIDTVLPEGSIHLYSREFASEDIVKSQTTSSDIVHFATHGFICSNNDFRLRSGYEKLLLYSGIALSGANGILDSKNSNNTSANDGILSGFEIARLDLIGTKLVTLSACETALGETLSGEGVFGLRRAFHQAGAESILMSLWKVPDQLCANLIPKFYNNWINKKYSKSKSLRKASLELLKQSRGKYNSGHPLLWSGFIIEGNTN